MTLGSFSPRDFNFNWIIFTKLSSQSATEDIQFDLPAWHSDGKHLFSNSSINSQTPSSGFSPNNFTISHEL
ncbi:MAG: hypothetical protein COA79_15690 [Planctomycetota bacterium]|nr:MAG: hypothetical protein COA79_15690 [Planctomycetota bacterium]